MTDRVVKVQLVIDEHGSVRVMRGMGEETERTTRKMGHMDHQVGVLSRSFGGLKGMLMSGLGFAGAGGLLFGLDQVAVKTKQIGTETERFSAVSGLGANESLRWEAAMKARGISSETVGHAIFKLGRTVKTAESQEHRFRQATEKASLAGKGSTAVMGAQAMAFKELGINAGQFAKLHPEQQMEKLMRSLSKMSDHNKRNAIALTLFNRAGVAMLPILKQGALGWEHQLDAARKFFPTLKGGKKGLDELAASEAESKMAWEGLELTLGLALIPVMTKVLSIMTGISQEVRHGTGFFGELAKGIEGAVHFGGELIGVMKKVADLVNLKISGSTVGWLLTAMAGAKLAGKLGIPLGFGGGKGAAVGAAERGIATDVAGGALASRLLAFTKLGFLGKSVGTLVGYEIAEGFFKKVLGNKGSVWETIFGGKTSPHDTAAPPGTKAWKEHGGVPMPHITRHGSQYSYEQGGYIHGGVSASVTGGVLAGSYTGKQELELYRREWREHRWRQPRAAEGVGGAVNAGHDTIHVHTTINLDGKKIGEAMSHHYRHHPHDVKPLAESITNYGHKRTALE